MALPSFKTASQESLPPDNEKSAQFFGRLGYGLADAVADLVDNSIDADAKNVHIRFIRSDTGIHSVIIADDGNGMTSVELREAMRFGSRSSKSGTELGKYGIGLKSASLSQADKVTVLSRRGKSTIGRCWTLENVKKNWTCDILREREVSEAFAVPFGEFTIARSGTIVVWEDLEHLQALPNHVGQVLTRKKKELLTELGIRFHRFIESGRLSISIDEQMALEEPGEISTYVTPLDPFGYERSPHNDYPAILNLKVGTSSFTAECHIWPPNSRVPNYRLGGGRVALRQGFYFYRNDRVIQAGGWNQIRADDGEPHFSLARVKVDLPSSLDSLFKLDVTKSRLDPAPAFLRALLSAKDARGITFDRYIDQAEKCYRKQKTKDRARFPVIPGTGLSKKAQQAITAILKEPGTEKPKKISFEWALLDSDEVIRVNPSGKTLLLNSRFRRDVSEGGSNDAPVLKLALMFLIQDEFRKSFSTKVSDEWIQKINLALIASLKK
jgi:hypothetical protein